MAELGVANDMGSGLILSGLVVSAVLPRVSVLLAWVPVVLAVSQMVLAPIVGEPIVSHVACCRASPWHPEPAAEIPRNRQVFCV